MRLTDEELGGIAYRVDQPGRAGIHWASNRSLVDRYAAMASAVAAHVRKEGGAAEQLAAAGWDFEVESKDGLAHVTICPSAGGSVGGATCSPTRVSETLLRLAGLPLPPLPTVANVKGLHESVMALVAHRPNVRVVITTNSRTATTVVELTADGGAKWKLQASQIDIEGCCMVDMVKLAVDALDTAEVTNGKA